MCIRDSTLTDNDLTPAVTRANATLISGTEPLAPSASLVFFVDSTINGDLTNTASTSGNPTDAGGNDIPGLSDPTDSDDAAVAEVAPDITIEKTVYAGNDGGAQCAPDTSGELVTGVNGDAVTYCFEITNTGDTFLDAVTLTDNDLTPAVTRANATLLSGTEPLAPSALSLIHISEPTRPY